MESMVSPVSCFVIIHIPAFQALSTNSSSYLSASIRRFFRVPSSPFRLDYSSFSKHLAFNKTKLSILLLHCQVHIWDCFVALEPVAGNLRQPTVIAITVVVDRICQSSQDRGGIWGRGQASEYLVCAAG